MSLWPWMPAPMSASWMLSFGRAWRGRGVLSERLGDEWAEAGGDGGKGCRLGCGLKECSAIRHLLGGLTFGWSRNYFAVAIRKVWDGAVVCPVFEEARSSGRRFLLLVHGVA